FLPTHTTLERGITGASSAASASGTRSPVVSNPANIGSPARTTSSPSSRIPYWMASLWLNRAIFTFSPYLPAPSPRLDIETPSGVQAIQPAVLVRGAAVLDVGELLAQRERELSDRLGL